MWGGSVVLTGFFRWVLSWRMGCGLVRGRGLGVCVFVLLRRGIDEVGGAVVGLLQLVVVILMCAVLRVWGFLTILWA